MTTTLPPEVAAYLEQAAIALAEEGSFSPSSLKEMDAWITDNFTIIVAVASEMMRNFTSKIICNEELKAEMVTHGASMVYEKIRSSGPPVIRWNPRYEAYAAANGRTPDQMRACEASMANFICWNAKA